MGGRAVKINYLSILNQQVQCLIDLLKEFSLDFIPSWAPEEIYFSFLCFLFVVIPTQWNQMSTDVSDFFLKF